MEREQGEQAYPLRDWRDERGLTQEELARHASVSTMTVSKIERGVQGRPHVATANALSRALRVKPGQVIEFRRSRVAALGVESERVAELRPRRVIPAPDYTEL